MSLFEHLIVGPLVRRAERTPYYDLPGYMRRLWLVPYKEVIKRKERACPPTDDESTDGTGPVPFKERPLAWLLQRFDIAVRVHTILRSDRDRWPHNHPWPYITVILRGGYWEHQYNSNGQYVAIKWYGPGRILFRKAQSWHKLELPEFQEAWTLFITFRKKQTWGFNANGRFVPYYQYDGDK